MHYLVIARDGSAEGTLERRREVRDQHLAEIGPLVTDGTISLGGAILDASGNPMGSAILIEADSEDDVRAILERDVYRTEGVWETFEIYPFRRAV